MKFLLAHLTCQHFILFHLILYIKTKPVHSSKEPRSKTHILDYFIDLINFCLEDIIETLCSSFLIAQLPLFHSTLVHFAYRYYSRRHTSWQGLVLLCILQIPILVFAFICFKIIWTCSNRPLVIVIIANIRNRSSWRTGVGLLFD